MIEMKNDYQGLDLGWTQAYLIISLFSFTNCQVLTSEILRLRSDQFQILNRYDTIQCIYRVFLNKCPMQGLVKGVILWFRNPYFYFRHGESTSTASKPTSPASQKSKDLNKVSLLLQDLGWNLEILTLNNSNL